MDNNAVKRPWLAIAKEYTFHQDILTEKLRAEIHQLASEPTSEDGLPYKWIWTGVGGAPWLVRNHEVKSTEIKNCSGASSGSCRNGASQVAVGLSHDGRWLFLVLAEKPDPEDTLLQGLAIFMKEQLGVWQAIKFDGGGSSQLWYGGYEDETDNGLIYREEERSLSQYLAVLAEPGQGIFMDQSSSTPTITPTNPWPTEPHEPPVDGLSWWDQFVQWWQKTTTKINKTWQEITQTTKEIQQAIKDLQKFTQDIQDPNWWLEQYINFVTQWCGMAVLLILVVGAFWLRRRANR